MAMWLWIWRRRKPIMEALEPQIHETLTGTDEIAP
jgi:hypothetical protein